MDNKPPQLTRSQRAADAVTEFCGSWTFIAVFSALTAGWIILNTVLVLTGIFDPYPFILFNLVLTIVSTFQSPLIMMSQNRQIERDRVIVQGLHAKLDALAARLENHGLDNSPTRNGAPLEVAADYSKGMPRR
jgi:uncharacterized membrane protein